MDQTGDVSVTNDLNKSTASRHSFMHKHLQKQKDSSLLELEGYEITTTPNRSNVYRQV